MRKLAFEHAGVGFEMPSLRMVNMEKENSNIAFAKVPKTVYKGTTFSYSRAMALKLASDTELTDLSIGADTITVAD